MYLYNDLNSLSTSAELLKFNFFTFHSKNCFTKISIFESTEKKSKPSKISVVAYIFNIVYKTNIWIIKTFSSNKTTGIKQICKTMIKLIPPPPL